ILEGIIDKSQSDRNSLIKELLQNRETGAVKMFLIYKAMKARNENIELFQKGEYIPLKAEGRYEKNIIVFARKLENRCAVIAVPRFLTSLIKETEFPTGKELWGDTRVIIPFENKKFCNELTNEDIDAAEGLPVDRVFNLFPAALMTSLI
ncbi:MAG TPA: hypothetical protein VMT35_05615, partial [Ignavibacteriaceae bacterium]|nr:hypothetical protein [Ignavibacteriaceae bacterium]